jgi:hypothetical protein
MSLLLLLGDGGEVLGEDDDDDISIADHSSNLVLRSMSHSSQSFLALSRSSDESIGTNRLTSSPTWYSYQSRIGLVSSFSSGGSDG